MHDTGDLDDTIIRLIEPTVLSRAARPASLPPVAEPEPDPSVAWSVSVRGSSAVVPLDRPVDIGRRPEPPRVPERLPARRVVIPAEFGEVSARHVRVEQVGDTIVVHDLGSTNGVTVHWAGGASRRLRRGESCAVLPDAVIELCDGVQLEFIASPHAEGA
ncbi:FHA domain-containing protein [Microcella sp.]|uniref:FHA domain-containing protein n=1 Tax=Microcella sp. TaxID=1913979 RepID=UPI002627D957|nr:FHA domain-containing protein [Microcella sp.]